MDLMINPTITKFAQKVDGEITELKLGAKQEDAYAQIYQKGVESGSGKVENNKAATINVSTYTQAVEITPTSGKTSMKKATITLSNIPSGISGIYGASTSGYNNGVLIITSYSDIGDFMEYRGSEQTFDAALADTENWSSVSTTISSSLNGLEVVGAEFSNLFKTITIDDSLFDISDLSSSFSSLTPYTP